MASSASFEFAVDEGDLVSLYYLPAGFGGNQYYSVVDGNNQLVTSSGQQEGNSIGLLACPSTPTCGMIEIVMTHEYGDGWWSNSLEVYKNDVLYLPIPFYFNYEQTTFIQSDNEDVFDFVYVGGQSFEPEYEGYRIYGPDGGLVINQDISGQIPESTVDIKFCEDQSGIEELESSQIKIYPNPTNGLIDIKVSENFLGSDVILYDVQGKIVGNWPLWNGDRLDLSAYKEGLYLIELQSKSKKVRSRVVLN